MLKITVLAALLAGSASVALASVDGDGNTIPGQSGVFARSMSSAWEGAYASEKPGRRHIERDSDGNAVPGSN
jgi:hypothetical protein